MMKRTFLLLLVWLPVALFAQIRGNNIVVNVYPDHDDWNYQVGEKAQFAVEVRKSESLLKNVCVE